ncbi:MAG: FG-GAP repeat domain-containing protein [Planctomycetota bacterium]|jgi:hypothetical protein
MHDARAKLLTAAATVLLWAATAPALINPNFTPVDLVRGADMILVLKLAPGANGEVKVEVRQVLLGKAPARTPLIDITRGQNKDHLKTIRKIVASGGGAAALLVVGADERGEDAAWMHLGGKWVDLYTEDGRTFEADQINKHMEATWAGGTDMLIRCVKYVQAAEHPDVPVRTGAAWADKIALGKVAGKVSAASAVDLAGDGKLALHVASGDGDKLFAHDGKDAFKDVTAGRKLTAKSLVSTWADMDRNGRCDLASWDGEALTVYAQGADGAFITRQRLKLKARCQSLSALHVGAASGPALLIGTAGAPLLLRPDAKGVLVAQSLDTGKADLKTLGSAGACLVGDLDADALADVLQVFEKGGLFYKASAPGKFAPAVATPIAMGPGPSGACLGDWAGDGRLDVFAATTDGCRLWHNRGKMKFLERLDRSGEIAYISQAFGFAGQPCDVNNDGRTDVLIVYSDRSPHIFFNRGFRSFGHSHQLDLQEQSLMPEAAEGLQAGCIADLNGDDAQDMAVVAPGGEVLVFLGEADDESASIRAALPLGGPFAGPITVTGYAGKRCLGAWNVSPGTSRALFGHHGVKQITLKWTFPGGREQTNVVKVTGKPIRVIIKPPMGSDLRSQLIGDDS